MYLNKVDSSTGRQSAFFETKVIDLSIEWKALFHGDIVGELVFQDPQLRFIKEKVPPKQLARDTTDFRILLKKFMPIKINRFELRNGTLAYIDSGATPLVNVEMTHSDVVATNLRNAYDNKELLPSTVTAHAALYEGTFGLNMKLNPLADHPTFDMDARLDNTNLVLLNDFFKAYGKFDVHRGLFGLYMEAAGKDGKFTGYVKPLIKDLDVVGPEDRNDNFLQKLWEEAVGAVGVVFRNQRKDQVATKIPIEGDFSKPNVEVWTAIVEILRNAFIQALYPSIDQEININSVGKKEDEHKSLIQKIFEKDKVPDKKKESDKKKEKDKKSE
jgi:hypothetical protein